MNILERYQLALSYKEKSESELRNWLELVKKKTFDQTHYDLVKATYDRHLKQSTELCEIIFNAQKNSIDDLEEEILAITRKQARLVRESQAGKLKPKKANEKGRELTNEKHRMETVLETARTIVEAKTTEDLGGFIEFEFEDYEFKLDTSESAYDPPPTIEDTEAIPKIKPKNVLMLVLAGALLWFSFNYLRTMGRASWESALSDHKQFLNIKCVNTGSSTIQVNLPWNNGDTTPDISNRQLKRINYGLLLYVREKGSTSYHLLTDPPKIWIVNNAPHTSSSPMSLTSDERIKIQLDTMALRQTGLKLDAIRVEVTRYGGRTVHRSQEVILP